MSLYRIHVVKGCDLSAVIQFVLCNGNHTFYTRLRYVFIIAEKAKGSAIVMALPFYDKNPKDRVQFLNLLLTPANPSVRQLLPPLLVKAPELLLQRAL
jgi:hypothetical protein